MFSAPAADLNWAKVQPAKPLTFVSSAQLRSGTCPYKKPDPRPDLPASVADTEAQLSEPRSWSAWERSGLAMSDIESVRPMLQALGYGPLDFEVFCNDLSLVGRSEMVVSAKSIPFFISARQKAVFLRLLDGLTTASELERHPDQLRQSSTGANLRSPVPPTSTSPHSAETIKQAWLGNGDEPSSIERPGLRRTATAAETLSSGEKLKESAGGLKQDVSAEPPTQTLKTRRSWRFRRQSSLNLKGKSGSTARKRSKGCCCELVTEVLLQLGPSMERATPRVYGRPRKARGCCSTLSRSPPLFIVLQAAVSLVLASMAAAREVSLCSILDGWTNSEYMGLETFYQGSTTFRIHDDCTDMRLDVWRWLTYQFSHRGFADLLVNLLQLLIAGLSVEVCFGCLKSAVFFNAGIVFGALASALVNTHGQALGMAAGCYSLLGLHFCDLSLFWKCRRFPWSKAVLVLLLIVLDFTVNRLYPTRSLTATGAWSTRAGGIVVGLLLGSWLLLQLQSDINGPEDSDSQDERDKSHATSVGKNSEHGAVGDVIAGKTCDIDVSRGQSRQRRSCRRILHGSLLIVAGALFAGGLVLLLPWPPRALWEDDPWCWARKASNVTYFKTDAWQCVRCGSESCIQRWTATTELEAVDIGDCAATLGWAYSEPT